MWRCPKDREVECANQRCDTICKVLQAREEFCPKVTLSEFYLRSSDSKEYPPRPSSELALINMVEVVNAIADAKPCVKDSNGNVIALTELLGFEPYAFLGQHIIKKIFDEHKTQEHISDEFLHSISLTGTIMNSIISRRCLKFLQPQQILLLPRLLLGRWPASFYLGGRKVKDPDSAYTRN